MVEKVILIIDDDEKLSKMLGFLFTAKGFKVEYAKSGGDAFEALNRMRPNVIILDIMMPGMDGFEVCKKFKEKEEIKDIPVIMLSALPSAQNREKSLELGAYSYFEKPFKSMDLVAKAIEALESSQ